MDLTSRIGRQPKVLLLAEALIAVLAIGLLDFLTGYELSFTIFYGIPILFVIWFVDKKWAYFFALLSALVWWWADTSAGHPYLVNWHQGWDTIVRLCIFLFVVIGGSAMKAERDQTWARITLIEHSRRLEREILNAGERERERIGQDLHDGLCQYFAAVACAAASLRRDLTSERSSQIAAAAEIEDLIKKGVTETRNLARGLFPIRNEENGLESALEELTLRTSHLVNVRCTFECRTSVQMPDADTSNHLYRITQEALNNAVKHGKPTHIDILLAAEDGEIKLVISDDGMGIALPLKEGDGMGLSIMRYRARTVGAAIEFSSPKQGGTQVILSLPQASC